MATASLQTIAEETGFSRSTVGHVLAGRGDELKVAKRTQQTIQEAAHRLGYRRSFFATSLSKGVSDLLIVLGAASGMPWRLARQTLTAQALFDQGHRVQMFDWRWGRAQRERFFELLADLRPRGIIVSDVHAQQTPVLARLMSTGTVIISGDGPRQPLPELEADGVYLDRQEVGYMAMRHLIELGHRRLACVQPSQRNAWELRDRWIGYQRALKEAGISSRAVRHVWPQPSPGRQHNKFSLQHHEDELMMGRRALPLLLELRPRPTGVVASNDRIAAGLLKACDEHGIRVPETMSIIGAENDPMGAYLHRPLTTLNFPIELMSRTAVSLLQHRLETPDGPITYRPMTPQLVARATTAPPGETASTPPTLVDHPGSVSP